MSEAKAAPEGKKKGKLPIMIVLALVLGGGGFFGMKMKGGGEKKEEPEIKLGTVVEIKDEFLTNMAERNSYVRTKISLQLKDGFDKAKVEHDLAPIQDIINMKLQATSIRSVASLDGLRKLKEEMAASINKLLTEEEAEKKSKKKKKKKKEDEDEEDEYEIPEGWDSAEGPVLKILFVSWATQ